MNCFRQQEVGIESQGDLTESQGDLTESQGSQKETPGFK